MKRCVAVPLTSPPRVGGRELWPLVLIACNGEPRSEPAHGPAPSPAVTVSASAPAKRWYVEHETSHCVYYSEVDGRRSKPRSARCTRQLQPGERARLAGRTCMRESLSPERAVPIICPDELLEITIGARTE